MRTILLLTFLSICSLAEGQTFTVTGDILDEKAQPLSAAAAVLLNPADSTLVYFSISGNSGRFEMKNVRKGSYLLQISLLGFNTIYRMIELPLSSGGDLGQLFMVPRLYNIDEVKISGERIPMRIKSDTIEYDAKAYKVQPDAVAEDLIRKLPGIEVDRAGNIKALGEDVKNVLVDGKEFFGNDPKVATRNLPVDAIGKVQLFDRPTDESRFTGIDDGERNPTLNFVLNEDKKNGIFGDVTAGAGTNERAEAGAKAYRFTQKSQIAAIGMYNNINQPGFSLRDYINFSGGLSSFSSGDGHVAVGGENSFPVNFGQPVYGTGSNGAAGFNLSVSNPDNDRFFISYLGNGSRREFSDFTTSRTYTPSGSFITESENRETKTDTAHKINAGLRMELGEKQNIIVNGGLSYNSSSDPYSIFSDSRLNDAQINNLQRWSKETVSRLSGNGDGSYLLKVNEGKTILKFSAKATWGGSKSDTRFSNRTEYFEDPSVAINNQFYNIGLETGAYSASLALTQKITKKSFVDFSLGGSISEENVERSQGELEGDRVPDQALSPDFSKSERSLRPGITWKLVTNKTNLTLGMLSSVGDYRTTLNDDQGTEKSYAYFTPSASMEYNYRTGRRLMFNYSTLVYTPRAMQLLPVVNNLNPLSLIYGNRDLKPEYLHSARLSWWLFDQFSFTTLLTSLNMRYSMNKVGYSRNIEENLRQVINLVNTRNDLSTGGMIDFSTAIKPLGLKINLVVDESFTKGYSYINDVENANKTLNQRVSFAISNRKKEKWDVETGTAVTFINTRYSLQKALNDKYRDISWFTEARYTPGKKLNFMTSADITRYSAGSFSEARLVPLINAETSYYFLKNQRGVLTLAAVDILNRNTGIVRLSELNVLTERRSSILGRYFMLSFKYRLNKMGDNNGGIDIQVKRR